MKKQLTSLLLLTALAASLLMLAITVFFPLAREDRVSIQPVQRLQAHPLQAPHVAKVSVGGQDAHSNPQ